ncbi:MAG: EAL domain-containing protein, partial [Chloroflexi bacterium]
MGRRHRRDLCGSSRRWSARSRHGQAARGPSMKRSSRPRVIEKLARADLPERWADLRMAKEPLAANDLQRALQENELVLHYQPIVDLRSGECRRVEALLRWRSRRGLVHPT